MLHWFGAYPPGRVSSQDRVITMKRRTDGCVPLLLIKAVRQEPDRESDRREGVPECALLCSSIDLAGFAVIPRVNRAATISSGMDEICGTCR